MKRFSDAADDELVQAYIAGNNEAFDVLLERHQNKLFSYIFFLVRDEELANDVFQETFVKAIMMMQQKRYVFSGKFSSWIMRIAHNYIVDQFRQDRKECVSLPDPIDQNHIYERNLLEDNVEASLICEQTHDEVRRMVERLPQNQREIVFMRFYQDLSFREIADILDISINTALGRMRYALINLRKMYTLRRTSLVTAAS
ncbi:MAG: sigma-70 family RNA polymerase sigma factor [Candidatus Paraprevotella stercoravium]|uniref:Sigma-70 family RNA polymerase sigma factor n=2 Tax=Bacteroidales TaxID=171549 RepID=A0ABT7U4R8_9BACE|nr:sigma-70 family RNA polymerase sigma factor [Candidatus Paraprevotella stercoravium]MDM8145516.1 sigma-70 family RNA polymerase sigma factor [Bacteroides eggerthii]